MTGRAVLSGYGQREAAKCSPRGAVSEQARLLGVPAPGNDQTPCDVKWDPVVGGRIGGRADVVGSGPGTGAGEEVIDAGHGVSLKGSTSWWAWGLVLVSARRAAGSWVEPVSDGNAAHARPPADELRPSEWCLCCSRAHTMILGSAGLTALFTLAVGHVGLPGGGAEAGGRARGARHSRSGAGEGVTVAHRGRVPHWC